jgi:hypothetical protein
MHLLPNIEIQPNLELKTQSKQLLGSLPLAIALPGVTVKNWRGNCHVSSRMSAAKCYVILPGPVLHSLVIFLPVLGIVLCSYIGISH